MTTTNFSPLIFSISIVSNGCPLYNNVVGKKQTCLYYMLIQLDTGFSKLNFFIWSR